MVEDQRTHAGFGIHHEAVGQLHADILRRQQRPHRLLILQIRARWGSRSCIVFRGSASEIDPASSTTADPANFTQAAMKPFGAGFGRLNRQSLQGV
jgi:hypothetical protein